MADFDFANSNPWTFLEYHITLMKMIRELSDLISLLAHEDALKKGGIETHRQTLLDIADRADVIKDFAGILELPKDLCKSLNYREM